MKILFTCHYIFDVNAGVVGVTWRLGQELEKLGHHVTYYSLDHLPSWLPGRVKVMLFPQFVTWRMITLLFTQGLDIVDGSTGDTWLWSAIIQPLWQAVSPQFRRPLVVARCHGLEHIEHEEYLEEVQRGNLRLSWVYPLYRGSVRLWEAATSMRTADWALFLNQCDRTYAVEKLGVAADRAHIIANGIPEAFLNRPLEPLPSPTEPLKIAQVGTYIVRKGVQYATPALNQILAKYPQVHLSLLGTQTPAPEVYADFAPELRDRITVVPYYSHDTLPELLQGHQIKLFPTVSEGFGVALIEAMACGLAPITTATPGPLEIVTEGYDALVIPTRDSEAIVQALETLISDREQLDEIRHHAYQSAQHYSWKQITQTNLAYYHQAFQHAMIAQPLDAPPLRQISVVLIAQNESECIAQAIASCQSFADEIVVVDGGSTDDTVEIARRLGATVYENPWPGFAAQRNFGADHASHDWIFFIDADEFVDPQLSESLLTWKRQPQLNANAFAVNRIGDFFDRWLDSKPDAEIMTRLYNKRVFRIKNVLVHEGPDVGDEPVIKLKGILWHAGFRDVSDLVIRFNKYTDLDAQKSYLAGKKFRLLRLIFKPPAKFLQKYLWHGMYRQGLAGFSLSVLWSYYAFLWELKLYEHYWKAKQSSQMRSHLPETIITPSVTQSTPEAIFK